MQVIHLVGSGGLAKEIVSYILDERTPRYRLAGCWGPEPFGNPRYNAFYRGGLDQLAQALAPDDGLLLCVASPRAKRRILAELEAVPADRWQTYVHPSAEVSSFAQIGRGCIITPQCIVTSDASLGDFVFMNTGSVVGHDAVVGAFTTLFPSTEVCGDVVLGEGCVFGIGAFAVPGVRLADGTRVRAGSVVWPEGDSHGLLSGNPAQRIAD